MMNANNQPANQPAIIGRHQQQGPQCERSNNTAHFTSTEVQGLLQVIEEILPFHGEEWHLDFPIETHLSFWGKRLCLIPHSDD